MSPTVLRQRGYRVMIFLNDHPPAHIHVSRAGNEARVRLDPVEILHNYGFSVREVREIVDIVTEDQDNLLARWDAYHISR